MMEGEYTSMSCIHAIVPDLCPRPIAWGTYQTLPDTHFFLCEFRDMTGQPPDAVPFAKKMAELHSKAVSPNGKFGFPVRTHHGHIPIDHDWADTWEEYFSTRKRPLIELEEASQGPSADLRQLSEPFFDVVVPRLLRPLETEGRKILPRLVHGDCWDGNASMDERSGLPIIFDAASFYAHNECTCRKPPTDCRAVRSRRSMWHFANVSGRRAGCMESRLESYRQVIRAAVH